MSSGSSASSLQDFISKFKPLIERGQRFLLLTHVRPDGDAYGCVLGLAHGLRELKKEVLLWNADGMVERYEFLPGADWIQSGPIPEEKVDAIIILDNANLERAGKIDFSKFAGIPVVNIDHHASNQGYGALAYIEPARASCAEVLFDIMKAAGIPIPRAAAECLFAGISTDTGSFQYPSVNQQTFQIAGELVALGVSIGELSRKIYESEPPRRLLLLREVLQSAQFDSENRIGFFWIDSKSYERSGARPEDSEGMIDHIRSIRSVLVAILFEELPSEGVTRISLRSKDSRVNVSEIAGQFGGGGHSAAAGARVKGPRQEVESRVLSAVRARLP
jgi:bifunctional oligoribonuclease and PAP phosphatase NrnA